MQRLIAATVLIALAALTPPAGHALAKPKLAQSRSEGWQTPRAPRLLVILVVDQMRADYVDKYGHQWSRGLHRLVTEGAWFRNAAYPYMNTVTCAGHATIATGSFPYAHGVILNDWWDRANARTQPCTADADFPYISYAKPLGGGASPRLLRLPTLADELRDQSVVKPRVVSLAMKDRSAVMMAGRHPDVVAWYSLTAGGLVSSTFYGPTPVPFLTDYATRHPVEADLGKTWTRAMPESRYLYEDDVEGETPPEPWTPRFPHVLQPQFAGAKPTLPYELWRETPFEDEYLLGAVKLAIETMRLGKGPGTDMLAISFSALDHVGHDFGPWSHEVQDILYRLDGAIGELLDAIDVAAGRGGYTLAFASDHGITPLPASSSKNGIDAGYVVPADVEEKLQSSLVPALGPGKHVAKISHTNVYFAPGVYATLRESPALLHAAMDQVASLPGVLRVIDGSTLAGAATSSNPTLRAAALSYVPGRSGDLIVVPRPYWVIKGEDPTTHGTPNPADARIPMIFFGRGIKRGEYVQPATPADIAPTLGFLAGVAMSSIDGRVLREILTGVPVS